MCGRDVDFNSLLPSDSFGAMCRSFEMPNLNGDCVTLVGLDGNVTTVCEDDGRDDDEKEFDSPGVNRVGLAGFKTITDTEAGAGWDNGNEDGRLESTPDKLFTFLAFDELLECLLIGCDCCWLELEDATSGPVTASSFSSPSTVVDLSSAPRPPGRGNSVLLEARGPLIKGPPRTLW